MLEQPEKSNEMRIPVSIVEDDAPARGLLGDWVQRAPGFRCVGRHACAEAALAALPIEKPSVVLMDINLPGISGIECVRRLKPLLPDTQFVMLTVYEDPEHIFNALAVGACGYLLKRVSRAELIEALQEVHAGGSPMSSNIARKVVQSFQRPAHQPSEAMKLSARELEVLELLARGLPPGPVDAARAGDSLATFQGLSLQGNRGITKDKSPDSEYLHPAHLRKIARPFPLPGGSQVHSYSRCRRQHGPAAQLRNKPNQVLS